MDNFDKLLYKVGYGLSNIFFVAGLFMNSFEILGIGFIHLIVAAGFNIKAFLKDIKKYNK